MPATIDPPAAPAQSTGVSQGAPSTGAAPSTFRPPNPAFEGVASRLSERLNKKAVPAAKPEPPSLPQPKPTTKTEPATESPPEQITPPEDSTTETQTPPEQTPETKEGEATPEAPKKEKKVSPWRMVDEYKKANAELKTKVEAFEKEISTLKTAKPAEAPKEIMERLEAAEKRVKEYEDHLRFVDYQRHPEFIEKYQKPYESAWKRATAEMAEVAITDPNTGVTRAATAEDMLALINLPLGEARKYANQIFGEFADDAMVHRKEIKSRFEIQRDALEDAKKTGIARQQQMQEQTEAQRSTIQKFLDETWSKATNEAVTDTKYGKYFAPVEGDRDGNSALARGLERWDKAFSKDPRDPSLSPQERAELIRNQAAQRYRSAAFGRMRRWLEQRDTRIAELEKMLDEFKESEPSLNGASSKPVTPAKSANPLDGFIENLNKKARR